MLAHDQEEDSDLQAEHCMFAIYLNILMEPKAVHKSTVTLYHNIKLYSKYLLSS